MAVKWAVASGNWNAGATWNDGVVPVSGDTVYLNGYTVNGNVSIDIGNGTIRNDLFEQTGRSGGMIRGSANSISISANVYCKSMIFASNFSAYNYSLSYRGHLICEGSGVNIINVGNYAVGSYNGTFEIGDNTLFATSANRSITINGNIYAGSGGLIANQALTALTVNGILGCGNATAITVLTVTNIDLPNNRNLSGTTLICNGNITIGDSSYINFTTASFNNNDGIVTVGHNSRYSATTHNFNGKLIQYYDDSLGMGGLTFGSTTVLHIQNPNFQWKNISEPRINSFIILTDWDFANEVQYPPENRVVAGIPYAFDEKVGTFTVDYPPETVVLKDYVYDGGEMVGILDLPQAPTTSDIVNAIKNDSDLGGKINTTNTSVGNISTAVTTIDGKVDIIDISVDTLLSRLTSVLTQRLGQSVTVEILQQILVAHLNN